MNDFFSQIPKHLQGIDIQELIKISLNRNTMIEDRRVALIIISRSNLPIQEKAAVVNKLLQDENYEVRFLAAYNAGSQMGDDLTVQLLRKMQKSESDEDLRRVILGALSQLDGLALLPLLRSQLQDEDFVCRCEALRLISQMTFPEVLGTIADVLKTHPDPQMRFGAALQLAYRGISDGESVLCDYIDDGSWIINSLAAAIGLSILANRNGLEKLLTILQRYELLEPGMQNYLIVLLCQHLNLTPRLKDQILADAKAWVTVRLAKN